MRFWANQFKESKGPTHPNQLLAAIPELLEKASFFSLEELRVLSDRSRASLRGLSDEQIKYILLSALHVANEDDRAHIKYWATRFKKARRPE